MRFGSPISGDHGVPKLDWGRRNGVVPLRVSSRSGCRQKELCCARRNSMIACLLTWRALLHRRVQICLPRPWHGFFQGNPMMRLQGVSCKTVATHNLQTGSWRKVEWASRFF
eukprot:359018-Chlamydomonas_euryale.AAC.2